MFTGIVAAIGQIVERIPREVGVRLRIQAPELDFSDISLGDSIACNGVCLTVVDFSAPTFCVDVSPESLSCTAGLDGLGMINLEKALRLSDRLGGHLVSGHVDGVGDVLAFDAIGDNRQLTIRAPQSLAPYLSRKGSVTVNGTSLTTNTVDGNVFSINLIPHTLVATTLGQTQVGDRVNLEVDLIARYVERLVNSGAIALDSLPLNLAHSG